MNNSLAVQLYSVRRETAVDAAATIRQVATFGYTGVELAGTYNWSAEQWQKLLAEANLQAVGTHLGLQALETDWEKQAAFHRSIGCARLIVPSLPKDLQTANGYKEAARRLNALGQRAKAAGFSFGYHNHAFEFAKLPEGGCGMEILLAETNPELVFFEVDTYWVEKGGRNSRKFIENNATRIGMIHAKELRTSDGADVPAGQGNVDFKAIIPLARQHGWPVVVEFEGENAINAVKESAAYLGKL
jgi:sugar phosphate isomerase/epimerase